MTRRSMNHDEIRRMFDRISPTYDRLNRLLSLGLDFAWRKEVLRSLPFEQGKILDCCTGTGELALLLARRGYDVIGIDSSESMLAIADRKRENGLSLAFVEGDVEELLFPDRTFQAVTCSFSLRNLKNLRRVFYEINRTLSHDGIALFLELTRPDSAWLSLLHRFYLRNFLPVAGGWISGDRAAYSYLGESILAFVPPLEIKRLLKECGFSRVDTKTLSGGIATLWSAVK